MYPIITLKPGKETNVHYKHPWIFSGALAQVPDHLEPGALVHIADTHNQIIGTGTYSQTSSIAIRIFAFEQTVLDQAWFAQKIKSAHDLRLLLGYGSNTNTTGYRVVFGEADGLPGLIIDRYANVIVFQSGTAGIDKLRSVIISAIKTVFSPQVIIEKSNAPARQEEKLTTQEQVHFGTITEPVPFLEHSLRFVADVVAGQKTGFFLDQKDLRLIIKQFAFGNTLNLFSYTGTAGIAALTGQATAVHNVDASELALTMCALQAKLNNINPERMTTENSDIFQWLQSKSGATYDTIIMDPPALIKNKRHIEEGAKAYHFLNRAALRLIKPGGIFVTSSCSHFLSETDLAVILRRASVQANVHLQILNIVRQAPDHPYSVYFPEGAYLKSFVCRVQ
ncbi:MAG: class I SAM-dependent rRNA methyltransferase [Patescibacteria group bacterium]|jgi:23S rRNA (cytosine1962-C5)-methyltransferase